jgi:hypothetical protein
LLLAYHIAYAHASMPRAVLAWWTARTANLCAIIVVLSSFNRTYVHGRVSAFACSNR